MLSHKYRNLQGSNPFQSEYVPVTLFLFGESSDSDTFITNSPDSARQVYETNANRFFPLPQGEDDSDLLLRRREYLKVGTSGDTQYKAVLLFHPNTSVTRETGDRIYNVERVSLRLTANSESRQEGLQAVLLSGAHVDETVTWRNQSVVSQQSWQSQGGDSAPSLSGEVAVGSWSEDGVLSFDLSEMYTQWNATGQSTLAIAIQSGSTELLGDQLQTFHSWDSNEGYLGDQILTNCRFLAAGDANSTRTEGVRAVLSAADGNILITQAETDPNRLSQFYSFQFSSPVGATFTLLDPDVNASVSLGTKICTVLDKPTTDSLLVGGFTLPNSLTEHHTTVEFAAETTVPYGSHILELANPSAETLREAKALYADQKLKIRYFNPPPNNNSKNFTVAFVSDETRYKSRVRVFLNEATVSENRNGLGTEILLSETKPALRLDLLLV